MKRSDRNYLNMAQTVQQIVEGNEKIWNKSKSFAEQVVLMNNQLKLLGIHQQQAEKKTKGVTKDKSLAAETAITMGKELAGNALVYAKKVKSEKLKTQFSIIDRDLKHVPGRVAVNRLKELYVNIEAIIDLLEDKVTKEELGDFNNAIKNFETQLSGPRKEIISRERSNAMIVGGVKNLRNIFEDMDNLLSKVKDTKFQEEFKLARIIIDLHGPGKGGGTENDVRNDEPMDDKQAK